MTTPNRKQLDVLIVSDNPEETHGLKKLLQSNQDLRQGVQADGCQIQDLRGCNPASYQACIFDLDSDRSDAISRLHWLLEVYPDLPVVAVTKDQDICSSGIPVSHGAQDCLNKTILTPEIMDRVIRFAVERHRAQKLLMASEARFKKLIEQNADGFVVVDETATIRFHNPAAERILGKNGQRLTGQPFTYPLRTDGPTEIVIANDNEPPTYAEVEVVETQWHGKKGHLASLRDITERKKGKKELEQQLQRLMLLNHITRAIAERQDLESIFQVLLRYLEDDLPVDFGQIWLTDAQKDTFSVVASGRGSYDLAEDLNIGKGTFLRKEALGIVEEIPRTPLLVSDSSRHGSRVMDAFAKAGLQTAVIAPLHAEERLLGLLLVARCKGHVFSEGEVSFLEQLAAHTALAFRQKQLFNDLQKTYEALRKTRTEILRQERLRALGQMASGIVHDINNALSPIVGYTDMLLEDACLKGGKSEKYLRTVRTAAGDISAIINRMRDFYRKRETEEKLLPLDINKIIAGAVQLTRPRWKDLSQRQGFVIEVRTHLEENLPLVSGVESELREAVINLILNGVDAMPGGGVLRITTKSDQENIIMEVADTGLGMDEDTKAHCLEPFFTTKGDNGTGLGLAMVYGTVQRHHGELEIESRLGEGTRIHIHLPSHQNVEERTGTDSSSIDLPHLRILCIDDEPALRVLVQEMLEQDGHSVITEDSGESGIDAFKQNMASGKPFDVVITDLGMPYVSGKDVARAIKSLAPVTPVVMLTGWEHIPREERELDDTTDCFLEKPPTLKRLRKALSEVLPAT